MSFPIHAGVFTEIELQDLQLHFNLNGEIIRAKGKGSGWTHPHEWLKRTMGNDWIYYSTGGYTGVYETTGEYYLPNMPYTTNGLLGGKPFQLDEVNTVIETWQDRITGIIKTEPSLPDDFRHFLESIAKNSQQSLAAKAAYLFSICGGRSTVLPPDTRHVDYNVIPLTVANGCLYKCRFCEVKNKKPFAPKSTDEIRSQIQHLKELYSHDLCNYNSIFLGEHDALHRGAATLLDTLDSCYEEFGFATSYISGCNAFLFGSASSLLNTPESFFKDLQQLPYAVYINIGLESADQQTLDMLGKPITTEIVTECFQRIQSINDTYSKTEVTANFVFDEGLPENHVPSFLHLVRDSLDRSKPKGCIYLSPLKFGSPSRAQTFVFNRLKVLSRVPTFLYIIQRL